MIELQKTPIERWQGLPLWIKRDDLCHPLYGGNKPRKLRRILAQAREQGATRLLTMGAAGSHLVLATGIFGRLSGMHVAALLAPQPRTAHALSVLRSTLGQGVEAIPAASLSALPAALAAARGASIIPVGGSSVEGTLGFVDAVDELVEAIERGELPEPRWVVAAAGSGGTVAGLAAGLAARGLRARVVGAAVGPVGAICAASKGLAALAARRIGASTRRAVGQLSIDASTVGAGYGHATAEGERATAMAHERGLTLDPTYTAKAMGLALRLARLERGPVLYWHTLSSAPSGPLLERAPAEHQIDPALLALLR